MWRPRWREKEEGCNEATALEAFERRGFRSRGLPGRIWRSSVMNSDRTREVLSRRIFLGGIAATAGSAILAACGGSAATDTPKPAAPAPTAAAAPAASGAAQPTAAATA